MLRDIPSLIIKAVDTLLVPGVNDSVLPVAEYFAPPGNIATGSRKISESLKKSMTSSVYSVIASQIKSLTRSPATVVDTLSHIESTPFNIFLQNL
uniref:Uncharacterized protein n=1 Tax=Amphimedon queenslandica TaxID=400682 RepID=A0A1X7VW87_AMPQE